MTIVGPLLLWSLNGLYLAAIARYVARHDVGRLDERVRYYSRGIGLAFVPIFVIPIVGSGFLDADYALPVLVGVFIEFTALIVFIASRHIRAMKTPVVTE